MGQAIPDFPPHFGDLLTDFGRGEAGVGINYSPGKVLSHFLSFFSFRTLVYLSFSFSLQPVIIEGCTMYSSSNSMTSTAAGAGVTSANSGLIFRNNIQVSFINGPYVSLLPPSLSSFSVPTLFYLILIFFDTDKLDGKVGQESTRIECTLLILSVHRYESPSLSLSFAVC